MYIDSQMNCYPCSFGIWDKSVSESLSDKTLREIWLGKKFAAFRNWKKESVLIAINRYFVKVVVRLERI